ncbi:hypothetical protein Q9R34_12735 [Enterobacter sp. BRE11]|nr:hypothetical protein [Enterobacter sp. BRE11]
MINENGGPAFPYSGVHKAEKENQIIDSHGMTLRDYFAGKAMQSVIHRYEGMGFGGNADSPEFIDVAEQAYFMADAMIAARGQ